MDECVICKKTDGTMTINDATIFPERYNGKPVCQDCEGLRQYLKGDIHS